MLSVYELDRVDQACRRHAISDHALKRFRTAFFKKALPLDECLQRLPESERDRFAATVHFHDLELAERRDSQRDGATKLLFRTRDGLLLETVILRIISGRTSLCISSQIGCAAGCDFCATGKMGLSRNLTRTEMMDQVLLAMRLLRTEGRVVRNVVMMGMGEPFHNEKTVHETLDVLRDPRGCYVSERHLLVSTVGMADAMVRFVEKYPRIRLALSLHSARQEVRRNLMPAGKSQRLEKLRAILPQLVQHQNFMVEYLMLKGVNDGPDDLAALLDWLGGLPVHINLIQFNAHPGSAYRAVSSAERESFGAALRKAGFKVTLRYSLGDDIAAACGQLAGVADGETKPRLS
jgi:23S rRNA (adenine2503-C2)-methyltransferase